MIKGSVTHTLHEEEDGSVHIEASFVGITGIEVLGIIESAAFTTKMRVLANTLAVEERAKKQATKTSTSKRGARGHKRK